MIKKYLFLLLTLILLIIPLISGWWIFGEEEITTCGDGTLKGECSENKPYFCEEGVLIEKALTCGCPPIKEQINGSCKFPNSSTNSKRIFSYFVHGEEGQIEMQLSKNILEKLEKQSKSIKYFGNATPKLKDFKLSTINNELQREAILPLVIKIQNHAPESKENQARIAISLVQNLEYEHTNKTALFFGREVEYSRTPYEVLYDKKGICGEKSELLVLLLKEIGYDTAFLFYPETNHEAVGIKCPKEEALIETEYCFIETTSPSILTDHQMDFSWGKILEEKPEVIEIPGKNLSLPKRMREYKDAEHFSSIREEMKKRTWIWPFKKIRFKKLKEKYGISENYYFI